MPKKTSPKAETPPNPGPGRPTDYRPEYAQKLIDYFDVEPYKEDDKGRLIPSDFKSLAGFAVKLKVHRDTLHEWANAVDEEGQLKHPEFSDAYRRVKDFQENFLMVNGNRELVPSNFAIFTCINALGMRQKAKDETPDVSVTQNNYASKSDEEIDRKLEELKAKLEKK